MWACAAALAPVSAAFAQDAQSAGIVRISDRGGARQVGHSTKGEYHAMPAGHGVTGNCPECYGGKHGYGSGCPDGKCGLFKEHYCSHSPDHGWSIPGKWPIHRRGVQYTNFYPSQYAGMNGGTGSGGNAPAYPMAYMPTDTTQLGFYYQHVPFWQPQPNPLPQRPVPAQWHHYAPTVYASDWGRGSSYGTGYGYGAGHGYGAGDCPTITDGTVISTSPTPAAQPTPVQAPAAMPPAPRPLPEPAAAPAPAPAQPAVPAPPAVP